MIRRSWTRTASIEETLGLWAASLREVKKRIRPLFGQERVARNAGLFLEGLLGDEQRKTGWMRAEAAGDPGPWRQQAILGRRDWDADGLRDIVRDYVIEHLADDDAVLVIDETGFLKQGKASCGVARQYTGSAGKITNCQIGVFSAYVSRHGHAFIDRALYLPKEWTDDPDRLEATYVPAGTGFATKPKLATRMIARAIAASAREGLDGLVDLPRSGAPPIYGAATDERIRKALDRPPPKGFARWKGPLIAKALGDVDVQYVWRSLREQKIDLGGRKSWCESNDPDFASKAADVVGLYMAPPERAIVLCIDEKPSIQALERAQGYLKLPNGRALTGHSHDYKRHGTTTLFAAFEVATGRVKAAHKKRRRRKEFLEFMDEIVAAYPKKRLEVIIDNLNTHKKNEDWLARHPRVTFHFTPTRASWPNQVEGWFSILQGQSLTGASFTSVQQLKAHMDAFIETYNVDAEPFVWTKSKVHQRRVKGRRIRDL